MLVTQSRSKRFGIGAVAAIALGFPTAAFGAGAEGPKVIRIDPSTGARTVLAVSSQLTALSGIAVGPAGTIYVVGKGKPSGVYSLSAPGFAFTPLATTSPISRPFGLAATGQALYTIDSGGVLGIDTSAPFTQKVVTPMGLSRIAASGPTVYGTPADGCEGNAAIGNAGVVAIDAATGNTKDVAKLDVCPEEPSGIAAVPNGTLVVTTPTRIIRVNPADGTSTTLSKGGLLRAAGNPAVTASGDVIIADASSGVLRISPAGKQSKLASGGDLVGVNAVALDAGGKIYVTVPAPPPLKVSAPSRQRFSASRGIRINVACSPRCIVGFRVKVTGVSPAYRESGELVDKQEDALHIGAKRTAYVKLAAKGSRRIAKALGRHRTVKATLSIIAEDDHFDAIGEATTLTVRLVR